MTSKNGIVIAEGKLMVDNYEGFAWIDETIDICELLREYDGKNIRLEIEVLK